MTRAIVTHFDGDPFTFNAWFTLYEKYWRGECDNVYATLCYNPKTIPSEAIGFQTRLIAGFPEVKLEVIPEVRPPEWGNEKTLKAIKEDYIGLIESDGLVYGKGIVDQCFRLMEKEGQDIVAPPWHLIDDPYFNGDLHSEGFMRCFTFVKKSILNKTDYDFMPHTVPVNTVIVDNFQTIRDVNLDCFGWLSWQLLLLTRKITMTPTNVLGPDNILSPYSNFKWVHIRQMSSSAIGAGGGEFGLWQAGSDKDILAHVMRLINGEFPDGPAEFTHIKAVAFKLLFYDILVSKQTLGDFVSDYRNMLEAVIDYYNLPREKIYEIKGFYRGLFNI
jgi:hypothetical protein